MKIFAVFLCLCGQGAFADSCVHLGDSGLIAILDTDFSVQERDGWVTLTLGTTMLMRTPFAISLGPADPVEATDSVVLENGMTLVYQTETDTEGGSGGLGARLSGVLGSTPPLGVKCEMQGDWPDAEWCLPQLGRLRTEAEGCGTQSD